jgi:hypothetical protein
MNYRRGFQRLYAVLTCGWIVFLLFALPSDRLKFWEVDDRRDVPPDTLPADIFDKKQSFTPTPLSLEGKGANDYAALAASVRLEALTAEDIDPELERGHFGDIVLNPDVAELGKRLKAKHPGSYDVLLDEAVGKSVMTKYLPNDWKTDAGPPIMKKGLDHIASVTKAPEPPPPYRYYAGRLMWLLGVAIGPPLVGYALLFLVLPWVFRGFRSAAQLPVDK